jgi:hypothetical protein
MVTMTLIKPTADGMIWEDLVKIRLYFGADAEIVIRPGFTSLRKPALIRHPN